MKNFIIYSHHKILSRLWNPGRWDGWGM